MSTDKRRLTDPAQVLAHDKRRLTDPAQVLAHDKRRLTDPAQVLAHDQTLRDLTDPAAGGHAVQHVVAAIEDAVVRAWPLPLWHDPGPRVVAVADNYDRLRYDRDAVTRDRRYSRYVGEGRMLRSHTTARVPALLDRLAARDEPEVWLSVPGICYRRDVIDSNHVGEPHQLDLWRIRRAGRALTGDDLSALIEAIVGAVLPGAAVRTPPSPHPYTLAGREIYADGVEIGECGLAHPEVLAGAGLPAGASGLAMGLGLDRLTMLAKGVPDIRLLRATDPRIAGQMGDLRPYRAVSAMPPVRRDLSLAVAADLDAELLGDRVREVLGGDAAAVEEVAVLGETPYAELPDSARSRMGLRPGQKNLLVRVVLRDLARTLTTAEANALRDRIYAGLHEGAHHEWSLTRPRPPEGDPVH
jgi:phenylalanyl-tRNA synthetase alpha chain